MLHNCPLPAIPLNLPQPNLSEHAKTILTRRYLRTKPDGTVAETPQELFWRVAWSIAQADRQYHTSEDVYATAEKFYHAMSQLRFLPNSPCFHGAGRKLQQLSACFVLPIEDSLESIFNTLKHAALIHHSGGGVGYSFSQLRPQGSYIASTGCRSSGPISFMKVFNVAAAEVTSGSVRMGANMGILQINHPDIEPFIHAKEDGTSLTQFNLSVAITDEFMHALAEDREYNLVSPHNQKVVGSRRAKDIFDQIVHNAWRNGDPGVVFIDTINNSDSNFLPDHYRVESTNPCGEQPLYPYESCVLGSINLTKFVTNQSINWDALRETIHTAVHFLDNVIDCNDFVIPQIEKMTKSTRRIGLGVMGFADVLIALNIAYDSQEAIEWAERLMSFVNDSAKIASEELAESRGAYPLFEQSSAFKQGEKKIRNATRTTIAPTGTIGIIADCSPGIEPLFYIAYKRKSLWSKNGAGIELMNINEKFENELKQRKIYSQELMEKICEHGSVQDLDEIPQELKRVFVTAHDISPEWHIKIQAAFQRHTNNAVSKTINFPHSATEQDVYNAYMLAYQLGCKGTTIYRDGSRSEQVISKAKATKAKSTPTLHIDLKNPTAQVPLEGNEKCPECGAPVDQCEGCFKCLSCGYSKCSN